MANQKVFDLIPDPEDASKFYISLPDGYRLVFADGEYVGRYDPLGSERVMSKAQTSGYGRVTKIDEYQRLALRTAPKDIQHKEAMQNCALGLCGESGEFADLVKKWIFQGHKADYDHMARELGDIAWYLAVAAWTMGIPLSKILETNVKKLEGRYPEKIFSVERSVNRKKGDL